ncbi:MAG: NAD(P)H-dependent glycerol-3-phosphate dehydrogenase [Boseongicola sp.]|nr:MAG: NAD(P)H-dependent glycerol-3-phosphate dehydrogenase [Boseongicola sp.]
MTEIGVLGAGAFGTSLALALSLDGSQVSLWCRDADVARQMSKSRKSGPRLPGHSLPDSLTIQTNIDDVKANICLLAVPTQQLSGFLANSPGLANRTLVACCKGIDRRTGLGPVETIHAVLPSASPALLTGPSFAADIAKGLPTALVLAAKEDARAETIQEALSRPRLRLYRTTDTIGAELGGALKNVIALAAGMAIGAGFGDSARASVIARGFAEMSRYAASKGALLETLHGLSGLGDLVLTCTSEKSRNFNAGQQFGRSEPPAASTIEGIATAAAIAQDADRSGLDMPLTQAVAAVTQGTLDVSTAVGNLLSRPVRKE